MKRTLFITKLLFIALCGSGWSAFADQNTAPSKLSVEKSLTDVPEWAAPCVLRLNSILPQERQLSSKSLEQTASWTRRDFGVFCDLINSQVPELTDITAKELLAQLNKEFIPQSTKPTLNTIFQPEPDKAYFNVVSLDHVAYYCMSNLNLYFPEESREKMYIGWRPMTYTRFEFAMFCARFHEVIPESKNTKAEFYLEYLKKEFAPELKRLNIN